jgi:hypothetical protein
MVDLHENSTLTDEWFAILRERLFTEARKMLYRAVVGGQKSMLPFPKTRRIPILLRNRCRTGEWSATDATYIDRNSACCFLRQLSITPDIPWWKQIHERP